MSAPLSLHSTGTLRLWRTTRTESLSGEHPPPARRRSASEDGRRGGWHVLRTRSDDEPQVVIGSVRKAAGAFRAAGPDGHRIGGPLDSGQWSTRSAAVAAIRDTDIAVMHR
jgi:hypothetical protein